jgi:hypothetical protein
MNPAMYVTILSCFEPMTVSRETYIEAQLTCPRKGTSKALLRTPTCESGFETRKSDGICGFFVSFFGYTNPEIAFRKVVLCSKICYGK